METPGTFSRGAECEGPAAPSWGRLGPAPQGSLAPDPRAWPCRGRDELGVQFSTGTVAIFSSAWRFWFRELRRLFLWQPSPELSGAQVSTAPTAPFPPTGMGMLTAPRWWAQMSLGDGRQECQAGAPTALGEGLPHIPPGSPLTSVGGTLTQRLANGEPHRCLSLALSASASGALGKAKQVLELTEPLGAGGGCLQGPRLAQARASPLPGRLSSPFPQSDSPVHFTLDLDLDLYPVLGF